MSEEQKTNQQIPADNQHPDQSDRESNWEDASQQSFDDVVYINDQELNLVEDEIFGHGGNHRNQAEEDEDEEEKEPREKHPDLSKAQFAYHMDSVYKLAISPTNPYMMVSGGGDDIAVIWNLENPKEPVNILEEHKDTVDNVIFNHDGKLLATGSMDSTVILWEAETGKKKFTLDGPGAEITFIDFHPKGNAIVAGSNDTTVWIWNGNNGAFVGALTGHEQEVTCGGFTPDGKLIVSGSADNSLKVWNPKTLENTFTIKGHGFHEEGLTSVAFQDKNPIVGTTSSDKTVCLSNYNTGKILGRTELHGDSVESIVFPKNYDIFISGSLDGFIRVFDSNKFNLKEKFPFLSGITKVDYSDERNTIVLSTVDGILYIFDHRNNNPAIKLTGNNECINDFRILKNDQIVSAGDDGRILLFDIRQI